MTAFAVCYNKFTRVKKLYKKLLDLLIENSNDDYEQTIVVYHSNAPEKAEKLKELLLENTNYKNIVTVAVGPTIGIHTGPSVIAYSYLKK